MVTMKLREEKKHTKNIIDYNCVISIDQWIIKLLLLFNCCSRNLGAEAAYNATVHDTSHMLYKIDYKFTRL